MEIQKILDNLNSAHAGNNEKTASDTTDSETPEESGDESGHKVAEKRSDLEDSLNYLLGEEVPVKEASDQSGQHSGSNDAVKQVEKIAGDLAEADLQATIKEAHAFGAAVFDGFISRANTYAGNTKTASHTAQQQSVQSNSDRQIKEAAAAGYQEAEQALQQLQDQQRQKVAHGTREQGIADALEKVAALSEDSFVRGQSHMNQLMQQLG